MSWHLDYIRIVSVPTVLSVTNLLFTSCHGMQLNKNGWNPTKVRNYRTVKTREEGRGRALRIESRLSIDLVTALKKNSVWKNKFGAEILGSRMGQGTWPWIFKCLSALDRSSIFFFFFWSKLWNGFKDASSGHLDRIYYCCCHSNIVCPPLDNIRSGTCAFTIGTSETSWFCGASVWFQLSCSPVPPWSFVSAKLYTVAVVAGLEVPASLMACSQ